MKKNLKLRNLYDEFYNLKFPEILDEEFLGDIYMELSLRGTEYVGLANTFLGGGRIELKSIEDVERLDASINALDSSDINDQAGFQQIKNYSKALLALARELKVSVK